MNNPEILIADYSWSGKTRRVADQLMDLLPGAGRYELTVPAGTFPTDMYATDAVATKQITDHAYPSLTTPLPELTNYRLILVGSPVWHGRPATPVHSFLQTLTGFTGMVASFFTGAGDQGDYDAVFHQWAPAGLTIGPSHENGANLSAWLTELTSKEV